MKLKCKREKQILWAMFDLPANQHSKSPQIRLDWLFWLAGRSKIDHRILFSLFYLNSYLFLSMKSLSEVAPGLLVIQIPIQAVWTRNKFSGNIEMSDILLNCDHFLTASVGCVENHIWTFKIESFYSNAFTMGWNYL